MRTLYLGSLLARICNYILFGSRGVSKDRAERSAPSGDKPPALHREGNLILCVCKAAIALISVSRYLPELISCLPILFKR